MTTRRSRPSFSSIDRASAPAIERPVVESGPADTRLWRRTARTVVVFVGVCSVFVGGLSVGAVSVTTQLLSDAPEEVAPAARPARPAGARVSGTPSVAGNTRANGVPKS